MQTQVLARDLVVGMYAASPGNKGPQEQYRIVNIEVYPDGTYEIITPITTYRKPGNQPFYIDTTDNPTEGDTENMTDYSLSGWKVAEQMIEFGERVLLYGPPGTGKTTAACLHKLNDRGLEVITLTEETPAESIRGHMIPDGPARMSWMDGPGTNAWRAGSRLVINEIDKACGDAMDLMHVICDDRSVAAMSLPNIEKETVRQSEGFQVIATMNGTPECLPEAVQDRFAVQVYIGTPHPKALSSLPTDLRKIAAKTAVIEDSQRRIGIRKWKAFAALRELTDPHVAAQGVFGEQWRTLVSQIEMHNA